MGRVFEALRRANTTAKSEPVKQRRSKTSEHRGGADHGLPSAKQIEEQLFVGSSILRADDSVHSSASTAHTADAPDGSALPGGMASRAVGATLDAAGATRATEYVTYDVSVARVEPHLVAITQPRSAYTEQFRALRTRILQAGERLRMKAFVI